MLRAILLVDDDDGFMMLMRRAFQKSRPEASLEYVKDGEEAIQYLARVGQYNDDAFPRPDLVLLDIKMPRVDGFEVLAWKRERPELQSIPFVVLSSSELQRDMDKAAELGARSYLIKPMDTEGLLKIVSSLEDFSFKG
jgi:CheY-like chemotaxis protein